MHIPVLLNEVLRFLDPKPGGFFIDGTVDGGGHAKAILARIAPGGVLLGVDWDARMIASSTLQSSNSKVILVHGNYADLPKTIERENLPKADGLLLDLGFSSEQLEAAGKGMSFLRDEPLRMTYDETLEPVSQILRQLEERDLVKILREYGEERYAPRIAKAIKEHLKKEKIESTGALARIISEAVPGGYERGRIHPATRTFQALRIYANDELGNLTRAIGALPRIVKSGGCVVILTFHSLEDRIVKHSFREMAKEGKVEILTKKPVGASEEELEVNPRSRSAKLRAAVIRES